MKKIIGLILAGVMLIGLCGCSVSETVENSLKDKDKYTAGNATITDKVENIEIDWASGEVALVTGEGNEIILEETYSGDLPDEKKMQWWLDGTTLRVRYNLSVIDLSIASQEKKLKVTIPKDLELKGLKIDSASGDIKTEEISIGSGSFGAASGNMDIHILKANDIALDSASGDIRAEIKNSTSIDADAASGKIGLKIGTTGKLDVDSASGDIEVEADEAKEASFDASSGDITCGFGKCPEKLDVDSSSGSVTISLPKDAGFTASVDAASGDFNSQIPLQKNGEKYVAGDGSGIIEIDTASGNVDLLEK